MKKIIPVILVGTSLLGGVSFAYAAKTDSSVWADSNSKEWGNTPESVKYVLSNVQISRSQGNNSSTKQTDLFSTKWLKEMQRSPSTYRLTESDKKWVDNVLANAESKNSNTWKPSNKTPVAPKTKENKVIQQPAIPDSKTVEVAKKETKPEKNKKGSAIIPTGTGLTQEEMQKQVNKMTKAESKPLPTPKMEAKEKPDLTPVKTEKKEDVKNVAENPVSKNENEKPKLSEMDEFIATLPVITDDVLPLSEIEQTKEEMADFREMYSEQRINQAIENAETKDIEENIKNKVEEDVEKVTNEKENVKPFESLPQQEKNTDNLLEKATTEKEPIKQEPVIKAVDNSWISSALKSLITIALFMFGIVLYIGKKLKDNKKLEKYI